MGNSKDCDIVGFINSVRKKAPADRENTFIQTEDDDKRKNLSFGVQLLNPKEPYKKNGKAPFHKSDEIYYILEGDGTLTVGEDDMEVKPGHAYLIPRNIPHWFHDNEQTIVFLYIFAGSDDADYLHTVAERSKEEVSKVIGEVAHTFGKIPTRHKDE